MSTEEKKESSLAERWRENHGSALVIIGLGFTILGASLVRLQRRLQAERVPAPVTIGVDMGGQAGHANLTVIVNGFETEEGVCRLVVYAKDNAEAPFLVVARETIRIVRHQAVTDLKYLFPGTYYVVAFHDLNLDDRRDGGPENPERFGYSNNAPGSWDSPDLQAASVDVGSGDHVVTFAVR